MATGEPNHGLSNQLGILHVVLALFMAAFSIYWMSITSSSIWMKSIGGALFITNFFLFLSAVGALLHAVLPLLALTPSVEEKLENAAVVSLFLALVLGSVAISLSTHKMADRYYQELRDYAVRNYLRKEVVDFTAIYSTYHSQSEYVHKRSTDANSVMIGLCACWFAVCLLDVILRVRSSAAAGEGENASLVDNQKNPL
jgi:multisubunit Na+/H+ antiporter MnhC subunit